MILQRYSFYMLLKNISGSLSEYEKIKNIKLYNLMGYLDIDEKQSRFDEIEKMEDKINGIEQSFAQKPPKNL